MYVNDVQNNNLLQIPPAILKRWLYPGRFADIESLQSNGSMSSFPCWWGLPGRLH